VVPLRFPIFILFKRDLAHDFVSSKCPPFSNNKLLSCESTIPFAAVLTIAEFTTLPESRTDLIKKTIGKYASEHGNARDSRKFSPMFDKRISESTVRGFRSLYQKEIKKNEMEIT
jgi:hypothetical protein